MAKMITQDELQYLEHVNKLIRETREALQVMERDAKQSFDVFLPIIYNYVTGMRSAQHDFTVIVRDMLKASKELEYLAGTHRDLAAYSTALNKLSETFKDPDVQAVIKMVKGMKNDRLESGT